MQTKIPIEKAVEIVGGQTALANSLKVSPGFISQWVCGRRPVPATRCLEIEQATGGKVTRYQLRPDVFGRAA